MIQIGAETLEEEALAEVCRILEGGGIVALPTETVYGLAANALDPAAVGRIFAAKGRPQDNPLIVHIAQWETLPLLAREIPDGARALAARYWPGPLTMVLKKTALVPEATSAGLDTVGVRMPSHPVMRAVIARCGFPLAAPSANRSGLPSTTTAEHCVADLSGRVDAIVLSGASKVGLESTVVSLAGDAPRLLRPGGVTLEQLEAVLGPVAVDAAVLGPAAPGAAPGAPGMKYKHYAPNAHVVMLLGPDESFCRYVNDRAGEGVAALCFSEERAALRVPCVAPGGHDEPQALARELFGALRGFDRAGVRTVYAHCPEPRGIGLAVYNRLIRAAAFEVIRL